MPQESKQLPPGCVRGADHFAPSAHACLSFQADGPGDKPPTPMSHSRKVGSSRQGGTSRLTGLGVVCLIPVQTTDSGER